MARRVVVDLADDLEAVAAVEVGRLEAVGAQGELAAAASACLVRHGFEEAASVSVVAGVLADPEVLDPARRPRSIRRHRRSMRRASCGPLRTDPGRRGCRWW